MHIRLISQKHRVSFAQETDPEITALQNQLIAAIFGVLIVYQQLSEVKGKSTTIT